MAHFLEPPGTPHPGGSRKCAGRIIFKYSFSRTGAITSGKLDMGIFEDIQVPYESGFLIKGN